MDELTLLRSVNNDRRGPSDAASAVTRQLLDAAAAEEAATPRRHPRRTRAAWSGGLSLAAAAAAIALVAVNVTGGGNVASAEAAEVLQGAADLSYQAVDFDLEPGQFLRIETTTEGLWQVGPDGQPVNQGSVAGWVERSTDVLYVPADRTLDWVWVRDTTPETPGGEAVQFYGDEALAKQARTEWFRGPVDPSDDVWKLSGGIVPSPAGDDHTYQLGLPEADQASMPRNPGELLAWYRERRGEATDSSASDSSTFSTISETLRWNLVPADLRAAMFEAIALMPDIRIIDRRTDQDGHDLVTLGMTARPESLGRFEMTIDTTTGLLLGTRTFGNLNTDAPAFPDDTPTDTTEVTTSVVDAAP